MATRASKKKASTQKKSGRSSKVRSGSEKAGVSLSDKEKKALRALDDEHTALPDHPVGNVLQEARELLAAARSRIAELVSGSKLKAGFEQELHAASDILDRAEAVWSVSRGRNISAELKDARKAAETLKAQVMAALRHFVSDDEDLLDEVDAIDEGTGDDDTISDLRKLVPLVRQHAKALEKAKKLPRPLIKALNDRANALSTLVAERAAEEHTAAVAGEDAIDLRNRAFCSLRARMEAVRSAGRYVFSGDKRALKHFRSTGTRYRKRRKAAEPSKT